MSCDFWMLKVKVLTGLQNTREEVKHISDFKFLGLHLCPHNLKYPAASLHVEEKQTSLTSEQHVLLHHRVS